MHSFHTQTTACIDMLPEFDIIHGWNHLKVVRIGVIQMGRRGADVKSVSEMLGHSNVSITLNRYVHPAISKKREYVNALSANYGQTNGQL